MSDLNNLDISQLTSYHVYAILGGLLVFYVIFRFIKRTYLKYKFNAYDPKVLPGYPIFSRNPVNVFRFKRDGKVLKMVWEFFRDYGHSWNCNMGHTIFVTEHPDNIKAVLATQFNEFVMGLRHSHFKPLLGDGVFTLDGEGWKTSRALLRPNFSREQVAHTQSVEVHIQNLAKHIRKNAGQPFDLQELFFRYTVDTSTEFLFGHSLFGLMSKEIGESPPPGSFDADAFYNSFNIAQEYCASRAWLQNFYWILNPPRFKRSSAVVHDFAKFYIEQALNLSPEELAKKSESGYIFLYELVKSTRDPVILRDQLLNIMIAGRDTTAGLLSMVFYELARNPDIYAKLKDDIYNCFGDGENADLDSITFESLKKCEYLKFVINETLRLYPSVPMNFRCATKDTTLPRGGGKNLDEPVLIEKGTVVAYVISATHRNPEYFGKDALEFKPERWADKSLKPGWAYLPFNGGPRICLGQQFALTETSYTIVRLIQLFPNLFSEDKSGEYPPPLHAQLTSCLTHGDWVRMY